LSVEGYEDLGRRDRVEAANLFDVLERRIVPLFYDRKARSVPRGWVRKIRSSLKTLGPKVSATRMLREYVEWAYDPAAARADALAANGYQRAKALAAWKANVQKQWSDVAIEAAGEDDLVPELGKSQKVLAQVRLGALTPDDVAVQLVHGPLDQGEFLMGELIEPMEVAGKAADGTTWCYNGSFSIERPGRYGFALRVVPSHPDLLTFAEVGRIAWATAGRARRICD
jgi:starch phosphorylase